MPHLGRLLFKVQTSRLLFISALPQCGYYSKYRRHSYYLFQLYRNAATIRSTDVTATIYFSSTAMRLLFEVQTSRLLFISALPQCGDYSKYRRHGYYLFQLYRNAATIRSTDVTATIYFSSTAMRLLFEVQTSWLLFISALPQCGYYSKYRRHGYYLFQHYRNVATVRGQLLFEVQTSRLLFISALPQCGDYSRAATIRSTDVTATIYFSATAMRRLFEAGYYSRCSIYSRKYDV